MLWILVFVLGSKGRGPWLLKPQRISQGQIRFSARWKIKFASGDSLIYRGEVVRQTKAHVSIHIMCGCSVG
jgi:hypothetical protein